VVHHEHQHESDDVERGGDQEGAAQADELRDAAPDDRAQRRSEPLGHLHLPDRARHPLARRELCGHRQRQRSIACEEPLHGAQREHVPRLRHVGHRRHHHDEARQRAFDHDLATEAIGQPSPQGGEECRHRGGDAEAQPRPERDFPHVADAQLLEIERQERHHEREAGEADERRRSHGEKVAPEAG
jgi:hypothetical protein